jgi:hypothetical protein
MPPRTDMPMMQPERSLGSVPVEKRVGRDATFVGTSVSR